MFIPPLFWGERKLLFWDLLLFFLTDGTCKCVPKQVGYRVTCLLKAPPPLIYPSSAIDPLPEQSLWLSENWEIFETLKDLSVQSLLV